MMNRIARALVNGLLCTAIGGTAGGIGLGVYFKTQVSADADYLQGKRDHHDRMTTAENAVLDRDNRMSKKEGAFLLVSLASFFVAGAAARLRQDDNGKKARHAARFNKSAAPDIQNSAPAPASAPPADVSVALKEEIAVPAKVVFKSTRAHHTANQGIKA